MHCIWQFLETIGGTINHSSGWVPTKTTESDINIMELLLQMGYDDQTIRKVNLCRLAKKVYFVSEIVKIGSLTLARGITKFQETAFHEDKFPNIEIPKLYEEIWTNVIRELILKVRSRDALGCIVSHKAFQWVQGDDSNILFQKHNGTLKVYQKDKGTNIYRASTEVRSKEKIYIVCRVIVHDEKRVSIDEWEAIAEEEAVNSTQKENCLTKEAEMQTEEDYIERFVHFARRTYPAIYFRLWRELQGLQNLLGISQGIRRGNIITVGDASVKHHRMSHSYILELKDESMAIQGEGPLPTDPEEATSTRAERMSLLAMVSLSVSIAEFFSLDSGKVEVYCDNDEALEIKLDRWISYTKYCGKDIDLIMETKELVDRSIIKFEMKNVQGHQDDEDAEHQVRRNIDMDERAKAVINHPNYQHDFCTPFFPAQKIALNIQGSIISGDIDKEVRLYYHGYKIEKRLHAQGLGSSIQHKIDWHTIENSVKSSSVTERVQILKVMHQQFPTMSLLHKSGRTDSPYCKRCDEEEPETNNHLFRCRHPNACQAVREAVKAFTKGMQKAKTCPLIQRALKTILIADAQNVEPTMPNKFLSSNGQYEAVQWAFWHQLEIGIEHMKRGFISYKWQQAQNLFEKRTDVRHENTTWSKTFFKMIFTYHVSIWKDRCSHLHTKLEDDGITLTRVEAKTEIEKLLSLPAKELTQAEKSLHENVKRYLRYGSEVTLVHWARLLRNVREDAILQKRKRSRKSSKLQSITKFLVSNRK